MRNPLVFAALVASSLASLPGAGPAVAQVARPQASENSAEAGPHRYYRQHRYYRRYARPSEDRYDARDKREASYAHRKRRVFHSLPNQRKIAEESGYKRVSDLVNFPKFFPGLGVIFVKPATLPIGPFLCFDRSDRLIATVYMVPIKDMEDHKSFDPPGFAGRADHVSIYFNAGHPGVDMPHYHFVIWHVSKKDEARVAK
jgi:hypothetical protein